MQTTFRLLTNRIFPAYRFLTSSSSNDKSSVSNGKVTNYDTTLHELVFTDHSKKDVRNVEKIYSEHARIYENFISEVGWIGYIQGTKYFHQELEKRNIPKNVSIIDIGAGTGLVGQELKKLGYCNLYALDISSEMLNEAAKKKLYHEYLIADLNHNFNLNSKSGKNVFDHAIAQGVIFPGHTRTSSLERIAKLLKKNGIFVFGVRAEVWDDKKFGYKETAQQMEEKIIWKQVGSIESANYNENISVYYLAYQIL